MKYKKKRSKTGQLGNASDRHVLIEESANQGMFLSGNVPIGASAKLNDEPIEGYAMGCAYWGTFQQGKVLILRCTLKGMCLIKDVLIREGANSKIYR